MGRKGKAIIIPLTVGLLKKISLYKMSYFPKPYSQNKNKIKVELDLSHYATQSDFKKCNKYGYIKIAKKDDLASLTSDADKLDIHTLETTPIDLSKLSNVVKMMLLKRLKTMNCLKMLMVLKTTDTSDLV